MHRHAARIVEAVRGCIGARFRPQGRDRDHGLDCIGVAMIAARAAGVDLRSPPYRLGGDHEAVLDIALAAAGLQRLTIPLPGDLLAVAPTACRRHLAIVTDRGVVHAHAGIGRVVEAPIDPAWTLVGAWRLPEGE